MTRASADPSTPPAAGTPVLDRLRRPLRDLRMSVIDRCNFRCTYCMPRELFGPGHAYLPKEALLTFEELTRLAGVFASLGTEKIRLTGGEPLLRRELDVLVGLLRAALPEMELTLTTNGSRLLPLAAGLHTAGLTRLTVSLDALDEPTFRAMNDAEFPVHRVLAGIEAAIEAGFSPIKINCVIRRGVNEHAIEQLAEHFTDPRHIVRYIEYMDVGNTNGWQMQDVVTAGEIAQRLESSGKLTELPPNYAGEVARRYRTAAGGEIGIIASVTQPFCQGCNRARLSADGRLFTCLFAATGTDLRTPLRAGASDAELAALIRQVWEARTDRYSEIRTQAGGLREKVEMSAIGG